MWLLGWRVRGYFSLNFHLTCYNIYTRCKNSEQKASCNSLEYLFFKNRTSRSYNFSQLVGFSLFMLQHILFSFLQEIDRENYSKRVGSTTEKYRFCERHPSFKTCTFQGIHSFLHSFIPSANIGQCATMHQACMRLRGAVALERFTVQCAD